MIFSQRKGILQQNISFLFFFLAFWRNFGPPKKRLATTKGQTRILGWHKGIIQLLTSFIVNSPKMPLVVDSHPKTNNHCSCGRSSVLLWKIPWPPLNLIRNLARRPVHHKLHIPLRSPGQGTL